jgi:hypothetical protein
MLINLSITNDKFLQVQDLVVITLKSSSPFEKKIETLNVTKEITNITFKLCRQLLKKVRFNKYFIRNRKASKSSFTVKSRDKEKHNLKGNKIIDGKPKGSRKSTKKFKFFFNGIKSYTAHH